MHLQYLLKKKSHLSGPMQSIHTVWFKGQLYWFAPNNAEQVKLGKEVLV